MKPEIFRKSLTPLDNYFFILSGDSGTLGRSELYALLESYDVPFSIEEAEDRFVLLKASDIRYAEQILGRAAYAISAGLHLGTIKPENINKAAEIVFSSGMMDGIETFRVDCYELAGSLSSVTVESKIAASIKKADPKLRVSMQNPEVVVVAADRGNSISIGHAQALKTKQRWEKRRPKMRPFFHASALLPKFSRALVNLSRIESGEFFLDPFCGSGGIVIEAALMGFDAVGIDLFQNMCRGALENLNAFGPSYASIIQGDARALPLDKAGGIATDIPYGRAAPVAAPSQRKLLEDFFRSASEILEQGKYAIVVHPSSLNIVTEGFTLANTHKIRVHRSLTRVVSEYRAISS